MNEIATNDFNYSLVDAKTKARLEVMVASKNGIEAYEYINHFKFVSSQNNKFF